MNESKNSSEEFRDQLYNTDTEGRRIGFFPKRPRGKLYNKRKTLSYILLVILFVSPWIKVNGNPLFLFNIFERKFSVFGQMFWPQDFFLFAVFMIGLFVLVTMFTVIFGRLWCGWACPQTIFLEMVYRRIEFWIEGDAGAQRRLEKAEWDGSKIFKRVLKHSIFLFIAFMVNNTMLAYIVGSDQLISFMSSSPAENPLFFMAVLFLTAAFYFVFSWFREQACIMVCPYGRLQGVLLDKDTMVINYDHKRGESRGRIKRNEERELGDCIDCKQCVAVCPTGIDIRNGTQLECVNCTACIDACDEVMEKVGFEPGLIRFASATQIEDGTPFKLTGRSKAYIGVMVVIVMLFSSFLMLKSDLDLSILRAPGKTFTRSTDGNLENLFTFKMINKTELDRKIVIKLGEDDGFVKMVGGDTLVLAAEAKTDGAFLINFPESKMESYSKKMNVEIWDGNDMIGTQKVSFLGPFN